ncbi:Lrp/AsnC family transcriptional regulator [Streptomyces sp. NPDC017529]|uniref:Lrp/AsnC family transcriptional regulator n=1 Tax=Streptomyces sp. NPDC017529 TaxID=3365000 RepID=UPI0037A9C81A
MSPVLDDVERGLVQALQIDGRAPFSKIAQVLGVSTQTVMRRFQRLRAEAGLRVVGLAEPARGGRTQWLVRLGATPGSSEALARSLARRPDTSWVKLTSAGTEIFTFVHASQGAHPPVLQKLPHTRGITAVSAHCLLHTYLGGPSGWRGREQTLTATQQRQLRPALPPDTARPAPLTDADHALIDALGHDGRASYADLARATGYTQATVARRLNDLRTRQVLFFDVEVDAAAYGITTQALLWMAVAPAHLEHVATTLATHRELAAVVATTGPTNLLAQALCSSPADLHRYLTRRLGALTQIHTLETAPVLRTFKAAGHLTPHPTG